jgi:hypothetical protein
VTAKALEIDSGVTWDAEDFGLIELSESRRFTSELIHLSESSAHPIHRALVQGIAAICTVIVRRCGAEIIVSPEVSLLAKDMSENMPK